MLNKSQNLPTARQIIKEAGFRMSNLGAGYAYCKDLPKSIPTIDNVFNLVHFTDADSDSGTIRRTDTPVFVYLDVSGQHCVRTATAQNLKKAIDLANSWYDDAVRCNGSLAMLQQIKQAA